MAEKNELKLRNFTDREAAAFLRISQVTLWRERRAGRISFRRVASKILYTQSDLENYLNNNKREAFNAPTAEAA